MNARVPTDVLAEAVIVLDAPYGKFHVGPLEASDHAGMRAEQLREVLIMLSDADKSNLMFRLAKPLGGEVCDMTKLALSDHLNREGFVAAAAFASEVFYFLLTIQHEGGPGVTLWLAQQLCDELRATLAGMAKERGAV